MASDNQHLEGRLHCSLYTKASKEKSMMLVIQIVFHLKLVYCEHGLL